MKTTVNFLMPGLGVKPMGGYKIVFEYANRLVEDGYSVNIIYPLSLNFFKSSIRSKLKTIYYSLFFSPKKLAKIEWFNIDRRVSNIVVWNLSEKRIPDSNICIATGAQTAFYLNRFDAISNDKKFYFIQGYETWVNGKQYLEETYRYPLKKIVIAEWLLDNVRAIGQDAILIHNGFDFDFFRYSVPIEKKNKYNIIMPYNKTPMKGCDVGFKALSIVKSYYPNLHVILFGVHRPRKTPNWYSVYIQPNKSTFNKIYNESAIFLGPSFSEGFCLTPPEAMQCGCAVVCTNIGGYTVVCKDNDTAMVGNVDSPESLANCIIKLISDDMLRYRIAHSGNKFIQEFTWDKAYEKFVGALMK